MLKIRLKRLGKKVKPFYKIVIIENLVKRDGGNIAEIGYYNPMSNFVYFNNPKLFYFINHGANPTSTVRHLIQKMLHQNNIKL